VVFEVEFFDFFHEVFSVGFAFVFADDGVGFSDYEIDYVRVFFDYFWHGVYCVFNSFAFV